MCLLKFDALPGTDVVSYLAERSMYSEQLVAEITLQMLEALDYVRTHHIISRILNFLFIFVFSRKKILFSIKKISVIIVILAFYNPFWFLNENPFRTDQNKRKLSLKKKSGFVDTEFVKTCDELVIDSMERPCLLEPWTL